MRRKITYIVCAVLFLAMDGCKKPFNPPAIKVNTSYLVVEGIINTGSDSTKITLSRTVKISEGVKSDPELHAGVVIESDKGDKYTLTEMDKGMYGMAPKDLNSSAKYRLSIKTSANKSYLSDYTPVKISPAIDSVGFAVQDAGVAVSVNTHDTGNNTRYYRWEYNGTWVFISAFYTQYKFVNGQVGLRLPNDQIFQCWGNDTSSTVVLGSTAKLTRDVVKDQPVTFLPYNDERLQERYSIIVRQYALTKEAFEFWTNLKKNTEQLGSVFDALPSEIRGNIYNPRDPSEPVIGYVSAGTIEKKRIYINHSGLPNWRAVTFYDKYGCIDDTVRGVQQHLLEGPHPVYMPIYAGLFAPAICVDCTLRGTVKKPDFWR